MDQCLLCLEATPTLEHIKCKLTNCTYIIHAECNIKMLHNLNKCPICRKEHTIHTNNISNNRYYFNLVTYYLKIFLINLLSAYIVLINELDAMGKEIWLEAYLDIEEDT